MNRSDSRRKGTPAVREAEAVHAIAFENVSKHFANAHYDAVHDVSLSIEEGAFVTILGASGSGKTTLLKMVNRLYDPDAGQVTLFGEDIRTVDVTRARRRTGYVIQQIGLFPHMTIEENIATVPRLLKWDKKRITDRVTELLTLVRLDPAEFRARYPSQLSGGQQQRVGLARALAADPKIMLLDEPFGAIDSITRTMLQDELVQIHGGLKKTFLFVTHEIEEAFKLASRVIIMNEGRVVQFDTPEHILQSPADGYVSALLAAAREKKRLWERFK